MRKFLKQASLALVVLGVAAAQAAPLEFLTEENPPLNFTRGGQVTGTGVRVVREMLKRSDVEARIAVQPWQKAFAQAGKDKQTCIFSTVRSPDREKSFQWIGPVSQGVYSVFALADFPDRINRVDDIKNYRVAVVRDARATFLRETGITQLVEGEDDADLTRKLTNDRSKAGGAELWMTQSFGAVPKAADAGVEVKPVFRGIMTRQYWLACNPGVPKPTVEKLNAALAAMRSDGMYMKLVDAENLP